MNIVFVFPFCSPHVNSISGGPIFLGANGHHVLVVTSRFAKSLKGVVSAPHSETTANTEFFRPYRDSNELIRRPSTHWPLVRMKLREFQPDAVVGFGDFNFRLPLKISRGFRIPYILFVEYLRPSKITLPIRGRTALRNLAPWLHDRLAREFIAWLSRRTAAIMCSYHGDQVYFPEFRRKGTSVTYVPWCTEIGDPPARLVRNRRTGIYVGSLERFKNSPELVAAIPLILEKTSVEKFTVIGPGEYAKHVLQLRSKYANRLVYKPSVSRPEALRAIAAAGFGYTPATDCGLGFIGDCWGLGTPLVATHSLDGFLRPGVDACVADAYTELPVLLEELLRSDDRYQRFQQAGLQRHAENYSAEAVGTKYLEVLEASLGRGS